MAQQALKTIEEYWQLFDTISSNIASQPILQQNENEGICGLILAAVTNTDNHARQNAENSLALIKQTNICLHVGDILKALAQSTNLEIINCVVPYVYSLIRSLKQLKVFSQDEILLEILAMLFCSMRNNLLSEKQLKILCSCIPHLIDLSCSGQEPDWFLLTILREAEKKFELQGDQKREVFIGLQIVMQSIMDVFSNEKLQTVMVGLLKKLFNILEAVSTSVFSEIQYSQQISFDCLEGSLQVLEMVLQVLSVSIQRIQNLNSELIAQFLDNGPLLNFFENILTYNFNIALRIRSDSDALAGISLITFDLAVPPMIPTQILNLLNGLKFNALKSLITMHNFYLQKENQLKNDVFDTSTITQTYPQFLAKYTQILVILCKQLYLSLAPQSQAYIDYIYNVRMCTQNLNFAVVLLSSSVSDQSIYKFFSSNYQDIFNEILLSLLCNGKRDYDSFQEDDDEFLRLEQDLYCNRESDILKSNGCDLLFRFSQYIDGFLAYAITFVCKTIDSALNTQNNDNSYQEPLSKYQNSHFANIDQTNRIETALLILIILAPQAGERKDLMKIIEATLKRHFRSGLVKISAISRMRCASLISFYSTFLFIDYDKQAKLYQAINTQLLSEMLVFLCEQLRNQDEQKGVGIAVDTLWRMINSAELKGCIESVITDLLETLTQLIESCQNTYFFDFLEKIIHNYIHVIKNYATNMIKNLSRRVVAEYTLIKGKKYQSSLLISKCIGCVIQFTMEERIMEDFYIYFEEDIILLLKYLDQVEEINFEDKLEELGTRVLQVVREYEECTDIICRNLENLYKKNSYSLTSETFFDLLVEVFRSEYLMYNKEYVICGVFRIAVDSISRLNLNQLTYQYSEFIQGCFLLHLGIQHCSKIFLTKEKLYEDVVLYLVNMYPTITQQQFYPLKYIQIFLLLFYYVPQKTILAVSNSKILPSLIEQLETVYLQKHLEQPYDRKVLAHGLVALIQNYQTAQMGLTDVVRVFKLALNALDYLKVNNNNIEHCQVVKEYAGKDLLEQKIISNRPQFDDDETWLQSKEDPADLYDITVSDLEFERLNNFYYKPERDFYPKIQKFDPLVLESDEYSMYQYLIKTLKKNQPELVASIENQLNNQEMKIYDSIMRAQVVQTAANQFQVRQIKKIKKKSQFTQVSHPSQVFAETIDVEKPNINYLDI